MQEMDSAKRQAEGKSERDPKQDKFLKKNLLKRKLQDLFEEFDDKPVQSEQPFESKTLGTIPRDIATKLFQLFKKGIEVHVGPLANQEEELEQEMSKLLETFEQKLDEAADDWHKEKILEAKHALAVGKGLLESLNGGSGSDAIGTLPESTSAKTIETPSLPITTNSNS